MKINHRIRVLLQLIAVACLGNGAQILNSAKHSSPKVIVEPTVKVKCLSGAMLITIKDAPANNELGLFSGMIYPKGLSKNSTCLSEYRNHEGPLRYKLSLRSCNTMPQETVDGGIEFFNTIVLQPHLKLVTDLGRGYHVRCRYKSRNAVNNMSPALSSAKTNWAENPQPYRSDDQNQNDPIKTNDRRDYGRSLDNTIYSTNSNDTDDVVVLIPSSSSSGNEIPMPACHMKIYSNEKIAESVKIGDALTLVINVDKQNNYGLHISDCLVRDGLGWGEQKLTDEEGCPMDKEIMGPFEYFDGRTAAKVTFAAHKFPYTASVYYQCNVNICPLDNPECHKEINCGENNKRSKRQSDIKDNNNEDVMATIETIEVYSGLYVNENVDISDSNEDSVFKEKTSNNELCVSQRTFAIAIAIAGLVLMSAVLAAVLCIMAKRRTKNVPNSGSSIYSGPYTNTAFSHSS